MPDARRAPALDRRAGHPARSRTASLPRSTEPGRIRRVHRAGPLSGGPRPSFRPALRPRPSLGPPVGGAGTPDHRCGEREPGQVLPPGAAVLALPPRWGPAARKSLLAIPVVSVRQGDLLPTEGPGPDRVPGSSVTGSGKHPTVGMGPAISPGQGAHLRRGGPVSETRRRVEPRPEDPAPGRPGGGTSRVASWGGAYPLPSCAPEGIRIFLGSNPWADGGGPGACGSRLCLLKRFLY
jgi:hypothetical protein